MLLAMLIARQRRGGHGTDSCETTCSRQIATDPRVQVVVILCASLNAWGGLRNIEVLAPASHGEIFHRVSLHDGRTSGETGFGWTFVRYILHRVLFPVIKPVNSLVWGKLDHRTLFCTVSPRGVKGSAVCCSTGPRWHPSCVCSM